MYKLLSRYRRHSYLLEQISCQSLVSCFCVLNQKMRTKICWSHQILEAQVHLRKLCANFKLFDSQDVMQSLSELLHLMVTL